MPRGAHNSWPVGHVNALLGIRAPGDNPLHKGGDSPDLVQPGRRPPEVAKRWLADCIHLTQDGNASSYKTNVDGTEPAQLMFGIPDLGNPAWLPDGGPIVFTEGSQIFLASPTTASSWP